MPGRRQRLRRAGLELHIAGAACLEVPLVHAPSVRAVCPEIAKQLLVQLRDCAATCLAGSSSVLERRVGPVIVKEIFCRQKPERSEESRIEERPSVDSCQQCRIVPHSRQLRLAVTKNLTQPAEMVQSEVIER